MTGTVHPYYEQIVIVGAGLAGLRAAERLRELGYGGSVVVVGEEPHRPYNRTPLSKQLLTGEMAVVDLRLQTFVDLGATWRVGSRAVALDPRARRVHLDDGRAVAYDGLILAGGMAARTLPGAPVNHPRVHTVRTVENGVALELAMKDARRVAVVGGGFIGCEVASAARKRAIAASLIDVSHELLAHGLGEALAPLATRLHRQHGVALHLGTRVEAWHSGTEAVGLKLADGTTVEAEAVVIGVGTVPRTEWLEGLGLDLSNGILCEATCHVVGLDDVVACGDIARWPNLRFDETPRRIEHWINAVEQGQHAAESLLRSRSEAEPFAPIPRFWSEQHGVRIQSSGLPRLGTSTQVTVGAVDDLRFLAEYRDAGGRLVGAIAFDAPRSLIAATKAIARDCPAPSGRLAEAAL